MKTILGLSIAPSRVGWVLVDATAPADRALDDDAFDIGDDDRVAAQGLAATRSAEAIAAASGYDIRSIGVTWCGDAESEAHELVALLTDAGCGDVRLVAPDGSDCADVDPLDAAYWAADAVATDEVPRLVAVTEQRGRQHRRRALTLRVAAAAIGLFAGMGTASGFLLSSGPGPANPEPIGQPQMVSAHVPVVPTHPPVTVRRTLTAGSESSRVVTRQETQLPARSGSGESVPAEQLSAVSGAAQRIQAAPVQAPPAIESHLPEAVSLPGPVVPGAAIPEPGLPGAAVPEPGLPIPASPGPPPQPGPETAPPQPMDPLTAALVTALP